MGRGATLSYYTSRSVQRQPAFSALDKARKRFFFGVAFLLLLAISAAIFYIGTHVKVVNLGYKINQEIQRKETLIEENKRLDLAIAQLKSPTRIENEAKNNLGFTMPQAGQIIYLSKLDNSTSLENFAKSIPKELDKNNPAPTIVAQTSVQAPAKKEVKVAVLPKPISVAKVEPAKNTPKVEVKKNTPAKTNTSKVIIAKIVEESPSRPEISPKIASNKLNSIKTKESIPAVMLDTMP